MCVCVCVGGGGGGEIGGGRHCQTPKSKAGLL